MYNIIVTTTWLSFTIHFVSKFSPASQRYKKKPHKEKPTLCQKRWKLPKLNYMHRMTSIDEDHHYTQVSNRTRLRVKWHKTFANLYFKFIYQKYLDPLTPHVPSFNLSWHFDRHIQYTFVGSLLKVKNYIIVFWKSILTLQQTRVLPTLPILSLKYLFWHHVWYLHQKVLQNLHV